MSHHLGKRLLPEFLAALAERGIAEAHVEELPDERGKTAMKMNLLGDEPDDDLPGANLLPRPLMPPLLRWHDALELWTKGFEDALRMLASSLSDLGGRIIFGKVNKIGLERSGLTSTGC